MIFLKKEVTNSEKLKIESKRKNPKKTSTKNEKSERNKEKRRKPRKNKEKRVCERYTPLRFTRSSQGPIQIEEQRGSRSRARRWERGLPMDTFF